jgi:hypothetical protein
MGQLLLELFEQVLIAMSVFRLSWKILLFNDVVVAQIVVDLFQLAVGWVTDSPHLPRVVIIAVVQIREVEVADRHLPIHWYLKLLVTRSKGLLQ